MTLKEVVSLRQPNPIAIFRAVEPSDGCNCAVDPGPEIGFVIVLWYRLKPISVALSLVVLVLGVLLVALLALLAAFGRVRG